MEDIVIVSAARTAVGKFGGSLAKVAATELGSIAINAALERAKLTGDALAEASGQVIMGQVLQAGNSQGPGRQAAAKAGIVAFSKSLAQEVGSRGITVNVVAPGFIATDMTDALPAERQEAYLASIPAGRFAQADEVAHAVAYLASEGAGYVSGAVLPVDGGLGMGH